MTNDFSPFSVIETIEAARDVLKENGWLKGEFAQDEAGKWVQVDSSEAVAFCAVGAVEHILGSKSWSKLHPNWKLYQKCMDALDEAVAAEDPEVDGGSIMGFNDSKAKTKDEVVAKFNSALRRLRKDEASS